MDERDRRHKREFEPPPWEIEAFRRFEAQRKEHEAEAELEIALAPVRAERVARPDASPPPEKEPVRSTRVLHAEESAEEAKLAQVTRAPSAAELETMLIGLKQQEPTAVKSYTVVANVVSALLVVAGTGFVIWAAFLFAKAGTNQGPLPALASMLLMVWGFMLVGGAVLLFRKYTV